ncbi:MAG: hypothetical protein SNJ55_10695 [Chloroherpetonaceae bacterium]
MRTNLALWGERYDLNTNALTKAVIEKVQSLSNSEKDLYLALLHFLYASGAAADEHADTEAKALLIKSGDVYAAINNPLKLREEVESLLDDLSGQGENPDKTWHIKSFRLASLLMQLPFDTATMELILDAATLLSRAMSVPADCPYTLLFYIYEQMKNPIYTRAFTAVEPDFWENYLAVMLKTMGRFLRDAVMEYVVYYELPPGGSNEIHLKLCEMLCRVAVKCCYLVHKASGLVETELDKKIYQFCTDSIVNKDPKPLITYSYRLLDLSSEDFFITLPKETINKYIVSAIESLSN